MSVVEPEQHFISFRFFVMHGNLNDIYGSRSGLGGVYIAISWLREGEQPVGLGGVVTDLRGKASFHSGGTLDKSGVWQFAYTKPGYEEVTTEEYYSDAQVHNIEQKLYEEGFVDEYADKAALEQAWNVQTEIEKLAMSFISALAIIMVFKVLQGFSMERVNPVA